jgi:hypothetical protein
MWSLLVRGKNGNSPILLMLGKHLSQPGHGPVKVVYVQTGDPFDQGDFVPADNPNKT